MHDHLRDMSGEQRPLLTWQYRCQTEMLLQLSQHDAFEVARRHPPHLLALWNQVIASGIIAIASSALAGVVRGHRHIASIANLADQQAGFGKTNTVELVGTVVRDLRSDRIEQVRIYDRCVLARVPPGAMAHLSKVHAVLQHVVERAATERRSVFRR